MNDEEYWKRQKGKVSTSKDKTIEKTHWEKIVEDIAKNQPAYDNRVNALFLTDDEFEKLKDPNFDLEEYRLKKNEPLINAYRNLIEIFKMYCDWKESYYPIVACWVIGTYFHDKMITYPYLYFNASKESGKSRSVRLITYMSKNGEMVNSMTEAVLFRTSGTLGIDEFERASRKGNENLMELLNSAYKKGVKVKRMKKTKDNSGEQMVVEDFEVFRPIVLANIWGMDAVLEDRTLPLFLEKTTSDFISNLLEIWDFDPKVRETKAILEENVVKCNVVTLQKVYVDWNHYLINNYITSGTNNYIKLHLFERIRDSNIRGRMLELSFPLILIADMIEEKVVDEVVESLKQIALEKNQEAFLENKDILVIDMVSQMEEDLGWISIKRLTEEFKQFIQSQEEWINERWIGRAIKRLLLAKEKKRTERGIEVILDIQKAQEKIKIFK